MKIATFNVNGVNGRLPRLLEWLAETQPDVVCLQETGDATFAARAFELAGYGALWRGQRASRRRDPRSREYAARSPSWTAA